jgi:hypothetical protein
MDTRLLEAAVNECRASHRAPTKACNRVWRTVSEWYKPGGDQTAHVVRGKVMLSKRMPAVLQSRIAHWEGGIESTIARFIASNRLVGISSRVMIVLPTLTGALDLRNGSANWSSWTSKL